MPKPIYCPAVTMLIALLFAISLLSSFDTSAEDWPGFQGADRDGVVQDGQLLTDWSNDRPTVAWSQPVGPGFGGAAIVEGKVYILDRDGFEGDRFRAYDLETGKELWTKGYAAPGRAGYHGSRSTPTISGRYAFTVGSFGHIACFDLEKQTIAWQKHMDDFGAPRPAWYWSQSPLLLGDLVVFAPMSDTAGLVAIEQATGKVAWKSESIGNEGYCSPRLVTLAGQEQIVTLTSTLVTGVDPSNGKLLWSYDGIPVKRGIPTPTLLDNDRLFITGGYGAGSALIEVTKQDGQFAAKELNRDTIHGGQIHSALLVGEHLYVNLNTNDNLRQRGKHADGLACFDLEGNLVWKNDNTPDINRGPVLAVGDYLLTLGGEDGVLRLIKPNPNRYEELASQKIFDTKGSKNMIWAPMAYTDGYLILRSQSELKCIDLRDQ